MNDQQESLIDGRANAYETFFVLRMEFIRKGQNKGVIEDRLTFIEADLMFRQVYCGFVDIPSEDEFHIELYRLYIDVDSKMPTHLRIPSTLQTLLLYSRHLQSILQNRLHFVLVPRLAVNAQDWFRA